MNTINPFPVSGYISPEYFCDRELEVQCIIREAENHANLTLISLRKMGKTGLIMHSIEELKKRKFKCVYLDIMMTNSLQDFVSEFGKAILNQAMPFSKKLIKTASQLFRAFIPIVTTDPMTGGINFELKLTRPDAVEFDLDNIFEFIKKSENNFFIAVDEFQQIVNYPEGNMEAILRSKIQFINNASFVFSGSKKNMMISMFSSYTRPFYQSVGIIELKPIDKEIYREFIINKLAEHKFSIDMESLDFIFDVSRGITYFIQLICHYLYNINQKKIDLKLTQDIYKQIVEERESYFSNFARLMTNKQIDVLKAIAKEDGIEKPTSSAFLNLYNLGSASTVQFVLESLTDKEVIYREEGKYYVADVLFAEWLKRI